MPLMGLGRHLMVAETASEARDVARRAFAVWYGSLKHLWQVHGHAFSHYPIPEDFNAARQAGMVIAGTPDEVTAGLSREIGRSGVSYVLTRFAYGDLSLKESVHSLNCSDQSDARVRSGDGVT